MLTALECLAKADELDTIAGQCPAGPARRSWFQTADGWRRAAVMARQQEAWSAFSPDD